MQEHPGRDELNLANFPVCILSGERSASETSVTYHERIIDGAGERSCTISIGDGSRLPQPCDEEVLVGMITLHHRQNGFSSPWLEFTPAEMIRLLGWPRQGWSNGRLTESVHLWHGVRLTYANAWFDKRTGDSVNAHVVVIASFQENFGSRGLRSFKVKWGDEVFESLATGHVREFDFETYRGLTSPISKRMFRHLGRQAHLHALTQRHDLKEFAFDKVGIQGRDRLDAGQIKQRLERGFAQLEEVGFLVRSEKSERYRRRADGGWDVTLRVTAPSPSPPPAPLLPAARELVDFGVGESVARELAENHAEGHIREKLGMARDKQARNHKFTSSPQAWLVDAIRKNYKPSTLDLRENFVRKTQGATQIPLVDADDARKKEAEKIWNEMSPAEQKDFMNDIETQYAEELAEIRSRATACRHNKMGKLLIKTAVEELRNKNILGIPEGPVVLD